MSNADELLNIVRDLVLQKAIGFDNRELEKVQKDDNFVRMFFTFYDEDVQKSVEAVLKCLRWRQKHDIANLTSGDLPSELFTCGKHTIGKDGSGRKFLYDRVGLFRRSPKFRKVILRTIFYKIDNLSDGEPCDLYCDLSGAGLSSVDIVLSKATTEIFEICFPGVFERAFIFGVPKLLLPALQTIINWIPQKFAQRVRFISTEEAFEQMGPERRTFVPEGLSTIREVCKRHGLTEREAIEIEANYERIKLACAEEH